MSDEFLLLFKKRVDNLIEQTKTISQKTLEFKMNTSKQTFFFQTPLKLKENNSLFGVTISEVCNSVYTITIKINCSFFSDSFWIDLVTLKRVIFL